MIASQQKPVDRPSIEVRCPVAGKHLKHEGQFALRFYKVALKVVIFIHASFIFLFFLIGSNL